MSVTDSNDVSALYPPPPPFLKFFTQENVSKLPEYETERELIKEEEEEEEEEQEEETGDDENALAQDGGKISSELDFLIPPPMPKSQQYRAFGSVWQVKDVLPDLEVMGINRLYKKASDDGEVVSYQYKIQELRKLLKSLLLNYLELVGILSVNPELYEAKVENIRTILINIHHLLNEYRPHQSRESLIMLLEEQLEHKKNEIKQIEDVCRQVQQKLENIQKNI